MTTTTTHGMQRLLAQHGYYGGAIDGVWGPKSAAALDTALGAGGKLAWGARVSDAFKQRVRSIASDLAMPRAGGADWLMACMAFETGETFNPGVRNAAGSGATGLIQFMPTTATALGTSVTELAGMGAADQLVYVHKYFAPYRGRLTALDDVYMAILWPAAIGKPPHHVLWTRETRPTTYRQNVGLDRNKDGAVTKAEAAAGVHAKLYKGWERDLLG